MLLLCFGFHGYGPATCFFGMPRNPCPIRPFLVTAQAIAIAQFFGVGYEGYGVTFLIKVSRQECCKLGCAWPHPRSSSARVDTGTAITLLVSPLIFLNVCPFSSIAESEWRRPRSQRLRATQFASAMPGRHSPHPEMPTA